MTERWMPVVGWEGWYEVSDRGRVRSIPRSIVRSNGWPQTFRGKVLSPGSVGKAGHVAVGLWKGGKIVSRSIHLLVLTAFVGPRPNGMQACHNNGVPDDNRLENLRWDTPSANSYDRVKHGHDRLANRTHCNNGHEFTPENTILRISEGSGRRCRTCRTAYSREYKQRRKATQ